MVKNIQAEAYNSMRTVVGDTNLRSIQPQSKSFLRMQNADVTKQRNEKRMTAEIVACEIDNERSKITTFLRNEITQILHPLQST